MGLAAGKLDRSITIQRYTVTGQNDANEDILVWATLAAVRAELTYRRANETPLAAEVSAYRIMRFVIRYSTVVADLNPKDRIEYPAASGVLFNISEVNEIGRREGLEIFATARSDGGTV